MKKYLFSLLFTLLFYGTVHADIGIGLTFCESYTIGSGNVYDSINNDFISDLDESNFLKNNSPNFGISFNYSNKHIGLSGNVYYKGIPNTIYNEDGSIFNTAIFSVVDSELSAKLFFRKYNNGLNPYISCSGTYRFLINNNELYTSENYRIFLNTDIGIDIRFSIFSINLQAGIGPITLLRDNTIYYFPKNILLNSSLSLLYRF